MSKLTKKVCRYFACAIIFLILHAANVNSAEYHITTFGDDKEGDGSIESPWRTPVFGASQLSTGDTLYIHEGTYFILGGAGNNVKPNSSNVTIQNYDDDIVFLDGGISPTDTTIVANGIDNVVFKGLTIKGLVFFNNTKGSVLENCEVTEGGDGWSGTDFGAVVFIKNTEDVVIRGCLLHDNVIASTPENSPLIMVYDSNNLTIEQNNIYNSVSGGIFIKDNPVNVHIRKNYIYDCPLAGIQGAHQDQGYNVYIYQNIIRNCGHKEGNHQGGIQIRMYCDGMYIYNNTFVDNYADIVNSFSGGIIDVQIWNNISYNPSTYHINGFSTDNNITYSNHNCFYNGGQWAFERVEYNSLFDWQIASNMDDESIYYNPDFVNPSGKRAEDFRLSNNSICLTKGRGDDFSNKIGAYISGAENIGSNLKSYETNITPPEKLKVTTAK